GKPVEVKRLNTHAPVRIRLRKFLGQLLRNAIHFGLGLRYGHTVFQTTHYRHPMEVVTDVGWTKCEWNPELIGQTILKARWSDTYNRVWLPVNSHRLSDQTGVRAK